MAQRAGEGYRVRLGHVRLKVRDMDRAISFYTRLLGMRLVEKTGNDFAFLSGSDAYHEVALQRVGAAAPAPAAEATGVDHVAFELADARQFARAYQALLQAGIAPRTVDNGISWAMYFSDADGNQLEFFCDRRRNPGGREHWEGRVDDLQPATILGALQEPTPRPSAPRGR
jgi:catechol 2,3-dioxygenase